MRRRGRSSSSRPHPAGYGVRGSRSSSARIRRGTSPSQSSPSSATAGSRLSATRWATTSARAASKARTRCTCPRQKCSMDAARLGPRSRWRGTSPPPIVRSPSRSFAVARPSSSRAPRPQRCGGPSPSWSATSAATRASPPAASCSPAPESSPLRTSRSCPATSSRFRSTGSACSRIRSAATRAGYAEMSPSGGVYQIADPSTGRA